MIRVTTFWFPQCPGAPGFVENPKQTSLSSRSFKPSGRLCCLGSREAAVWQMVRSGPMGLQFHGLWWNFCASCSPWVVEQTVYMKCIQSGCPDGASAKGRYWNRGCKQLQRPVTSCGRWRHPSLWVMWMVGMQELGEHFPAPLLPQTCR